LLHSFEANDSDVAALAFTPDGKLLVIGTTKGVVRVMDVATWKVTRAIDLDTPIYSLAASMSRVAVGYGDGTIALLNLDGEQTSVPEGKKQTERISALAFNANGDRFASASADGTIKIWETEGLKLICSLEGNRGQVRSVVFSPNGYQVTSGGVSGSITCWTVP
jgi:WD40 repeat protein